MEQKLFPIDFLGTPIQGIYVKEISLAEHLLSQLMEKDVTFGFDLETMSLPAFRHDTTAPLDTLRSKPRLVQICDGKNVIVFDLLHMPLSLFRPFIESKRTIAHNAMFEIKHIIHNFKAQLFNVGCTYIATKLLHHAIYVDDSGIGASLEDVSKSLLKVDLFKNIDHQCWSEPELNYEQISYAAMDAVVVPKLAEKLSVGLQKFGLGKVYQLYKEAQAPLAHMELNGIKLDTPRHLELISEWKARAYAAKKEVMEMTGLEDLTSHTIADYLERILPSEVLDIWPRTETEKLSTSADTFSEFSYLNVVEPFSRFQKATILSSTFGMKLQHKVNEISGRVHARYKLCGTRTGRLSSSDPNLQNMPRSDEMRSIFIPERGNVFVVADFNQIELRVAAELSGDDAMQRAYRGGIDLHALTASKSSRRRLEDVTSEDRQKAKALNFGLLFGLGKAKFKHYAKKSYGVDMTEGEAYDSVTNWHDLYSGYSAWQQDQAQKCEHDLYATTVSGKRRKLSSDNYYGASANTPVQGSASEAMLHALIQLEKQRLLPEYRIINTVHDEIIVECEDNETIISDVSTIVEMAMTKGYQKLFPNGLTRGLVKVGHGINWAEAK